MFKRYQQYKETKQYNQEMKRLRKQQERKQKLRLLIVFSAIMVVVFAAMLGMELATPPEASDSSVSVTTSPETPEDIQNEQQVTSEIERFAYVVTKPLETLTSEDLEFVEEMVGDPCYEDNVSLPQEQMIDAITACKFPQ